MAKKKSKAKKKPARDPEQTRRAVLGASMTIGAIAVLGGGAIGLTEVNHTATEALRGAPMLIEIQWPQIEAQGEGGQPLGTWMPESEKARLLALAETVWRGGSPMSGEPLREISRALHKEGWFTEPPRVSREASRTIVGGVEHRVIRVDGPWRMPAAVVRTGNRERMVSWEGVPLPLEYSAGGSRVRHLSEPAVAVLPTNHPGGEPWPGRTMGQRAGEKPVSDIADGLTLLDILDDDPGIIAQVYGLDLNSGSHIEIVTDKGTRIRWGSGPLRFQPGERTSPEKLNRLRYLLENTGRIDGNAKLIEIDGPQVLIVND